MLSNQSCGESFGHEKPFAYRKCHALVLVLVRQAHGKIEMRELNFLRRITATRSPLRDHSRSI